MNLIEQPIGEFSKPVPGIQRKLSSEIVVLDTHASPLVKALRELFSEVRSASFEHGLRSFAVSSDRNDRMQSVVAANLAVSGAQAGLRTLLVDANFSLSLQASIFGIAADQAGISEWVASGEGIAALSRYGLECYPKLVVVPAGVTGKNSQVLQSVNLAHILREMTRLIDLVIIDAPSFEHSGDAVAVASLAMGTVLVCESGASKMPEVVQFRERVEAGGGKIVAAALLR